MTAAVRSLRRSLSRSPSKFHLTGPSQPPLAAAAPTTTSPKDVPAAPEGLLATPNASSSSSGQYLSFPSAHQIFDTAALLSPHNLTPSTYTPKSSLKLSVRSARPKTVVTRPLSRTRVSPKSPLKRVFGVSPDSGNSNLPALPSPTAAQGQENLGDMILGSSPASRRHPERSSRHSLHLDVSGSSKSSISRLLDATEAFPSSTVSPLKRNDATMNLDQASLGSPVAKRRSLHGISSFGNDFNIFDHPINPTPSADAQDDANQEYQLSGSSAASFREPLPSPTPVVSRRTTSLRKSTLQQRHDGNATRTSWGRRAGEKQLAQLTNDASSPNSRFRPRLSLDQYVPLENERGSPFAPGPLPNPSVHPATRQAHQPHPLSRTITQSSSSSASLQDETPTHVPMKVGERPRVPFSFAKSLPPGASRPLVSMSTEQAVATPNYKHAKPFQGAFMSTGLVSKVNRNPEQLPANKFASSKPTFVMPDTPCKKQSYPSATFPPHPGSGRRSSRPSFGSPTTPFNSAPKASPRDKTGEALFRPNRSSHGRKGSVFSVDGDDNVDLHGAGDDILPPTPTKNLFRTSILGTNARQSASPLSADLGPRKAASPIRKSNISLPASLCEQEEADASRGHPVSHVEMSPCLTLSLSSFGRSRARRGSFATPSPVQTAPLTSPLAPPPTTHAEKKGLTETDAAAAGTPLERNLDREGSPLKNFMDSMMGPPDASRLSISNQQDFSLPPPSRGDPSASLPPATPTMEGREVFLGLGGANHGLSITPNNRQSPSDVDEVLLKMFDKADMVGTGEFSQVYRVSKKPRPATFNGFSTPSWRTPPTPEPAVVYAVKKVRLPANSTRGRLARYQEVKILDILSHSDKVVHYIRSWEQNECLYIQTEFCEEGSLEHFLKSAGNVGRLDDFRIWKILIEACQVSQQTLPLITRRGLPGLGRRL